jgi:hypothetical protein
MLGYTANGGADYYVSSNNVNDILRMRFYVLTEDAEGNWNLEDFEQQVAGQVKTLLVTPSGNKPVRLIRIENEDNFDVTGTIYVYEQDTVTLGVPQTPGKVRGKIYDGNNQTQMSHMTIPSGYFGFLKQISIGITRSGGNIAAARFVYFSRRFGKIFKNKGAVGVTTSGNSHFDNQRGFFDIIPPKTDFKITVTNASATIGAYALYDLILIKTELLDY